MRAHNNMLFSLEFSVISRQPEASVDSFIPRSVERSRLDISVANFFIETLVPYANGYAYAFACLL